MHKLSISQAKELIRFNARIMNTVTFVWGQFGVGKSQMMRQIATENPNDWLVDIRAGMFESVDFRGLPDRGFHGTGKDKVQLTVWNIPSVLPVVGNPHFEGCTGTIWLFLDESNQASQAVQGILYQIAEDRQAGEHKLLPNVRIVMAGNREGVDRGVVNKQPLPLSNRINHFELIVSKDDFLAYQRTQGILPPLAYAFYEFRPALLNTYDPANPAMLGVKTVATPRTTERMWAVWASKEKLSEPVKQAIMAGWVGEAVVAEIVTFEKIYRMIKDYLPEIRRDPATCRMPRQAYLDHAQQARLKDMPADAALGLQCAVTVAVSGEMDMANADAFYKFLKRLPPDFTVMAMGMALERDPVLYGSDAFLEYAEAYKQTFAA